MTKYQNLVYSTVLVLLGLFIRPIASWLVGDNQEILQSVDDYAHIVVIVGLAWFLIALLRLIKSWLLSRYDLSKEDNLFSRKVHTEINILEKVIIIVIIIVAVGLILLSFESIRKVGLTLFASAGVAGIIIGLSAQKVIGTLLAGIQIAITQPFRIDDAVLVENEWGWIEDIHLSYVVVRIWDNRRMVLPSSYFLDKPFQNWTRNSADLIGSVFLYTDYTISFDALREELSRVLQTTPLWDGKVNVLQVTDSKPTSVEIRILVSAKNSPTAWDLRVYVREKMIVFIQENYPQSLPRTRVILEQEQPSPPEAGRT